MNFGQPYNKPRVFLSHSQKDTEFIEKLANDLRRSQIEPWLFTYEIRHGKPWLDEIFRHGMPTCDAIIAYLTEASLTSPVVAKEIDTGILQKLSDSNVAFLPYVNNAKIRALLRPDIQAIQSPVWNAENYYTLLPVVVSEIWRSYLERTVSSAMKDERLKRVEAELELEKYKSEPDEVFTKAENKEFEFIWNAFNRTTLLGIMGHWDSDSDAQKHDQPARNFILHLSTVVALLSDILAGDYYNSDSLSTVLSDVVRQSFASQLRELHFVFSNARLPGYKKFTQELLTHGLIEKFTFTSRIDDSEYLEVKLELSKKYYRFRFCLAYQMKLPERILIELVPEN
jgi:hypothetical protein